MATLGSPVFAPFHVGTLWCLRHALDGFSRATGAGLATQVAAGRHLKVLEVGGPRLRVRLLEDGYPCWLERQDLAAAALPTDTPRLPRLDRAAIAARLDGVLAFAEQARLRPNQYLWGAPWARILIVPVWSRPPMPPQASGFPGMPICRSASAGRWPCGWGKRACWNPGI